MKRVKAGIPCYHNLSIDVQIVMRLHVDRRIYNWFDHTGCRPVSLYLYPSTRLSDVQLDVVVQLDLHNHKRSCFEGQRRVRSRSRHRSGCIVAVNVLSVKELLTPTMAHFLQLEAYSPRGPF